MFYYVATLIVVIAVTALFIREWLQCRKAINQAIDQHLETIHDIGFSRPDREPDAAPHEPQRYAVRYVLRIRSRVVRLCAGLRGAH
jgi:hypothetical protein